MALERLEGWEPRLNDVIAAATERPFSWGGQDCMLFAADCVEAVTGTDPAADLRGTYDSKETGMAVLKSAGGVSRLIARIAGRAGCREIVPAYGKRGDVCVVRVTMRDGRKALALGVLTAEGLIAVPGPERLTFLPRADALRCYSSG